MDALGAALGNTTYTWKESLEEIWGYMQEIINLESFQGAAA